jgi:xanthine/CO dehydrogenase XdhC/CoxF family maturation factor
LSELPALARRLAAAVAKAGQEAGKQTGAALALATVVSTEGSVYRRAGAWMTVDPDGVRQGQVSGGCLEADLAERAAAVLARGVPETVTYDTRQPDDLLWGLGMGCQGVVRLLVEPLRGERLRRLAAFFAHAADLAQPAVLLTVISGPPDALGERLLVTADAVVSSGAASHLEEIAGEIAREARQSLESLEAESTGSGAFRPAAGTYIKGALEIGREILSPRPQLIVCGAGEDAVPLASLAGELDWRVLVIDHRAAWARPERFPGARVVALASPGDLPGLFAAAHARTAAVVMSHNFERDAQYAAALLPLGLPYLGLLGPKRRGEQILRTAEALVSEGRRAARVFSPVGLDVAAETPREIALAIVAEISAVLAGRSGGHLADRETSIHAPAAGRRIGAPQETDR